MGISMKKRVILLGVTAIFLAVIFFYGTIQTKHTFTLSDDKGAMKSEQIQPPFGTVKVKGDCDTDVVFTDVETGERYVIEYITAGASEKIQLEKGKWYTVTAGGNLRISPVNVRDH